MRTVRIVEIHSTATQESPSVMLFTSRDSDIPLGTNWLCYLIIICPNLYLKTHPRIVCSVSRRPHVRVVQSESCMEDKALGFIFVPSLGCHCWNPGLCVYPKGMGGEAPSLPRRAVRLYSYARRMRLFLLQALELVPHLLSILLTLGLLILWVCELLPVRVQRSDFPLARDTTVCSSVLCESESPFPRQHHNKCD